MFLNDFKRSLNQKRFINKAEDVAETVFRRTRKYLPTIARVFLVSGFLSDASLNILTFSWRVERASSILFDSTFLGYLYTTIFIGVQIIASLLLIARKHVEYSAITLGAAALIKAIMYNYITYLWYWFYYVWEFGGLVMLVIENRPEARNVFAGLPSMDDENQSKSRNILQLIGRILVCSTVWRMMPGTNTDLTVTGTALAIVTSVFVVCVFIGFKTKISAIGIIVNLVLYNIIFNFTYWFSLEHTSYFLLSHYVFQMTSATGGLLFVVLLGGGALSIDGRKKE